ncbi:MAG: DUF86 domain-containing protein [Thermoplasmata archaeon]
MKMDISVYVQDIIESITRIEDYTRNVTEEEFYENTQVQDAVLRRLEIMGEAVKNIPDETKERHKGIPWKEIAGLRDILIHGYFGVNLKRIWKVVKEDIPELRVRILEVKREIEGENA